MYCDLFPKDNKHTYFKKRGSVNTQKIIVDSESNQINNKHKQKIYLLKLVFVELKFLKKILVFLKRIVRRKNINIYISITINHLLTYKIKNSRMGKGKGKF